MRPNKRMPKRHWLIVDGYNMIGSWGWLQELAQEDIAAARDALAHTLLDYVGWTDQTLLLVYDAYDGRGSERATRLAAEAEHLLIYTARGQTADQYIERFVREQDGEFTVASSDGLVQVMIFAHATRMSARELQIAIEREKKAFENDALTVSVQKQGLSARLSDEALQALEAMRRGESKATEEKKEEPLAEANRAEPSEAAEAPRKKRRRRKKKPKSEEKPPEIQAKATRPTGDDNGSAKKTKKKRP